MGAVSYQPYYVRCTYPQWDLPLTRDGGTDDITLVSISSFVMTFRNGQGSDTTGTGTFSLKTNNPAEVYYQPSVADVAAPFSGNLFISCTFPGGFIAVYDPIPFVISAS